MDDTVELEELRLETTESKRIGLVLASIHTGAANALWSDIARFSQEEGNTLFVFPGGRLECLEDHEHLRNSLYPLVHSGNLDGIIVWGSSLGGSVSIEEVQQQYRRFGLLPCVTLGLKREGFPNIAFDAYCGVMGLLQHCITVHGAKRIAFIRGPENHLSSDDRYRAYIDTLKQNGFAYDPLLVTDPFPWTEGDKAVEQLLLERALQPGVDFDLLACSSDMMMFAAGKKLEELGYSIPEDSKIIGFNDSSESHLLKVPCTTAKMPVMQMALMAWGMIAQMVGKKSDFAPDILLPCESVIRQSCGCEYTLGGYDHAKGVFTDKEAFLSYLADTFALEAQVSKEVAEVCSLSSGLSGKGDDKTVSQILSKVANLVYTFLDKGGDPSQLSEALHWYSLFYANETFLLRMGDAIRDLFLRQHSLIAHEHAYALSLRTKHLNSFKSDLLGVRTLSSHPQLLLRHLPPLGIEGCLIVLNDDENMSRFVGGFEAARLYEKEILFNKSDLLPPSINEHLATGVYVVEPLFMENQPLGYLVIKTMLFEGSIMEELRTALSSSIQASFLLDEANKAKELAERAQRARTEFFANVSEGLRNPLEEIQAQVETLKGEQYAALKSAVHEKVFQATHLLDLSLSETGELELDCQVLDPTSLIEEVVWQNTIAYEGPECLPAIIADRFRVKQVCTILANHLQKEGSKVSLSTAILSEGLVFSFKSSSQGWQAFLSKQDPGISLAESLILLHGGSFWFQQNAVSFRLPWPTLSMESPSLVDLPFVYITDEQESGLPPSFSSMQKVSMMSASSLLQKIQGLSRFGGILWDARRKSPALMLLLHQLVHAKKASPLAFVCLGCPSGASSLRGALNFASGELMVISLGQIPAEIASLLSPTEGLSLQTEEEYWQLEGEKEPSMLVTDTLSLGFFREICKKKTGSSLPIVLIRDSFSSQEVDDLSLLPNLLMVHTSVVASSELLSRLIALGGGEDLLPPLTSALVKKAQLYIGEHATKQFSRWQLAEAVNVSEDYLTRIFRREIGLSPWDYLNRHRVYLATELLRQTTLTINEIASRTGFQDQAYFCRVFKKIKGFPPGKERTGE
ncbi:MAG: substrate-binding domain-containing protein [Sphaerochaeta sp.]|nr:substrate-binding domain-containing protein [Sphaerochaeta sp.]